VARVIPATQRSLAKPVLSPVEGRTPRFYSALDHHDDRELSRLAEPSLAQEMGLLRLRVAEMLTDDESDWRLTLRSLEVLVRMAIVQQGISPHEDGAADALARLGTDIKRLFKPKGKRHEPPARSAGNTTGRTHDG
jgi:hypothetical protein